MANPDIPREAPLPSPQEYQKEVFKETYEEAINFLEGVLKWWEEKKDDIMYWLDSLVKNWKITKLDKDAIISLLDKLKAKGVVMEDWRVDMVKLRQFVKDLNIEDLKRLKLLAEEMEKYK